MLRRWDTVLLTSYRESTLHDLLARLREIADTRHQYVSSSTSLRLEHSEAGLQGSFETNTVLVSPKYHY
ncbi:hypothetical protein K431DRAFT_287081 [Polychaeton citri CBS 116435]|uniref:Uncharacterized protein n=1 Tax=Polychaeton citri CBS 116435 TaxID=1314669 RepID=A0A9P4UMQ7_9PEZI|nr:hypothetical protein K431DRAFT_287081 [Polychaeton citri CBS 116435]